MTRPELVKFLLEQNLQVDVSLHRAGDSFHYDGSIEVVAYTEDSVLNAIKNAQRYGFNVRVYPRS